MMWSNHSKPMSCLKKWGQSWVGASLRQILKLYKPGSQEIIMWDGVRHLLLFSRSPTHGFMYGNVLSWCVRVYSPSVAVDSGKGWQSTPRYAFPCSPAFRTVHPPLKSLQVGSWPVSVSLDRLIGAIPICVQVADRAVFFPACVFGTRYIPFREFGRAEEWRRRWKEGKKMKN